MGAETIVFYFLLIGIARINAVVLCYVMLFSSDALLDKPICVIVIE